MKKMLFAVIAIVLVSMGSLQAQNDCHLDYRTETEDGWGARPNASSAALYLHSNFGEAFPNGLTIGCERTLTFTSAKSITNFLPSDGGPLVLAMSVLDPKIKLGSLAGQLTALYLSIGFDGHDTSFANADSSLGDLMIRTGTFKGWDVSELLVEANNTFGGCASNYSAWELASALKSVNENFAQGQISGNYLSCPGEASSSRIPMVRQVYPVLTDGRVETNSNRKKYEFYTLPKAR